MQKTYSKHTANVQQNHSKITAEQFFLERKLAANSQMLHDMQQFCSKYAENMQWKCSWTIFSWKKVYSKKPDVACHAAILQQICRKYAANLQQIYSKIAGISSKTKNIDTVFSIDLWKKLVLGWDIKKLFKYFSLSYLLLNLGDKCIDCHSFKS